MTNGVLALSQAELRPHAVEVTGFAPAPSRSRTERSSPELHLAENCRAERPELIERLSRHTAARARARTKHAASELNAAEPDLETSSLPEGDANQALARRCHREELNLCRRSSQNRVPFRGTVAKANGLSGWNRTSGLVVPDHAL